MRRVLHRRFAGVPRRLLVLGYEAMESHGGESISFGNQTD